MWHQWWPAAEQMAELLMHLAGKDFEVAVALQRQAHQDHFFAVYNMAACQNRLLHVAVNSALHKVLSSEHTVKHCIDNWTVTT